MAEARKTTRQNHLDLAQQILNLILARGLKSGDHLPEQAFSAACGVSRTPIRAAFKILEEKEILKWKEEEGYFLDADGAEEIAEAGRKLEALDNSLASRILSDRAERRISDVQSVSALVRRYGASRSTVLLALKILSRDGIVTQLPGRSWAFQPVLDSPNAVEESLTFRLTVEPQAILSPGFVLDPQRAGLIRAKTVELLNLGEGRITAAAFHRIDTDFHALIAECSGNRFISATLLAHQRLRQATQRDTQLPDFRLRQSLEEHLDILDSLERAQFDLAADQMVLHLRRARIRRPEAANRGIPPLMKGRR